MILKLLRTIVVVAACFWGAKALVGSYMEDSATTVATSERFDEITRQEAIESGVDAEATEKVLAVVKAVTSNQQSVSTIEEAYGDIKDRSTKEIRIFLNNNPERKARVGFALTKVMGDGFNLPLQLDEFTELTGLKYDEAAGSVVYHYTISDEALTAYEGQMNNFRQALEELNPDGTCKSSLSLLAQGFNMTYSYRDTNGAELFTIVRTYEACEILGFDRFS